MAVDTYSIRVKTHGAYDIEVVCNAETDHVIRERQIINITPFSKANPGYRGSFRADENTSSAGVMPSEAFFGKKRKEEDSLEVGLSVDVREFYH